MNKTEHISRTRAILLILVLLLALWFFMFTALELFKVAVLCGFGLLALLILFWPQAKRLLQNLWKKRGARVVLIVVALLLASLLIGLTVFCGQVVSGMRQPESDAETVIVLGCQVKDGRPSQLLQHRIDAAAEYLQAHPNAVCIASGGQGWNESISEAACIEHGLVAKGVDASRIFREENSTTTQENLLFSKQIMEENGLSGRVLIVSNNFHIYRALKLAASQGIDADGLPASCEWYMLPTYVFREALALMYHCLLG